MISPGREREIKWADYHLTACSSFLLSIAQGKTKQMFSHGWVFLLRPLRARRKTCCLYGLRERSCRKRLHTWKVCEWNVRRGESFEWTEIESVCLFSLGNMREITKCAHFNLYECERRYTEMSSQSSVSTGSILSLLSWHPIGEWSESYCLSVKTETCHL